MTKINILNSLDVIAKWSVYVLVLTLPFSKSLIEASIVTGLICVLARKAIAKENIITSPSMADAALGVFVAVCFLSVINTGYMDLSVKALFTKVLKFAALFLMTKEIINTREKLRDLVAIAALTSFVILIDGLIQLFLTHEDLLHKYPSFLYETCKPLVLGVPTASFPYPNDFAAWILVMIFPAMSFILMASAGWRAKAAALVISGLATYSLFLTQVRGAWLAFAASLGVFMIAKFKKTGAVILVLVLAALITNKSVSERFLLFTSVKDRGVMWTNSMKMLKQHPVIGNGINTFYVNYAKVREDEYRNKKGSYAHNCYLQMAVETGVIGLAAFLFFILSVMLKSLKRMIFCRADEHEWLSAGLTAGLLAFLAHSAVDTNLYSLPLAALFWLGMGVLAALMKIQENDKCTVNS